MISYLLMKNKNEQFQTETYKLFTLVLLYSFIIVKLGCKYYSLYYKPNVIKCKSFTELTIPQNFYLISTLFALSCNNFISFYLSIELGLISFIGLLFISQLPTLIFITLTICLINMLFALFSLYGLSLLQYYYAHQLSPSLVIGCVKLGLSFYLPFVFIFLSCIGKFGVFPSSFGILPIVDGMSLFNIVILFVLNKYIYLVLLYYFNKSLMYDTASVMIILG